MTKPELLPEEEVSLTFCRMGRPALNTVLNGTLFAAATGVPTERTDSNHAGAPVFLTSDGVVRPGATSTLSGYDWFPSAGRFRGMNANVRSTALLGVDRTRYCPETGFLQGHGSVYSPQIGTTVAKEKKKEKPKDEVCKKEYVGHVSLLK